MQIWDTAGQERFQSIAPLYYRDAHAVLIVFDVTSQDSFTNLGSWIDKLEQTGPEKVCVCLIGNKIDLEDHRVVSSDQIAKLARELNATYQETSALDDSGINVTTNTMPSNHLGSV